MKAKLLRVLFAPLLAVIGATAVARIAASFLSGLNVLRFDGIAGFAVHVLLSALLYIILLFLLGAIKKDEVRGFWRRAFGKC